MKFIPFVLMWLMGIGLFAQINIKPTASNSEQPIALPNASTDWKTYETDQYSIQFPASWELNESPQMGMIFSIMSPLESTEDMFRENVNLVTESLRNPSGAIVTLAQYNEAAKVQISRYFNDYKLMDNFKVEDAQQETSCMIYSASQGIYKLVFMQNSCINNHKAYVLTMTSEQGSFGQIKETGTKILNSFKLK